MNPDDSVLVVLVKSVHDLEIIEREHWYRMPVRSAPRSFSAVQYLAFYLPRAFGERKWSIDRYARVRGHELVRRLDLIPDEPDHPRANELYYKLQLGAIEVRARPIISRRGRRVLFLETTWERFEKANELNELFVTSPSKERLWRTLEENNLEAERELVIRDGRARYRVDLLLYLARGQLAVRVEDGSGLGPRFGKLRQITVSEDDVENHLEDTLARIKQEARSLGISHKEIGRA